MKLRVARHTTDVRNIAAFYIDILGLEYLGGFEGHDGYDGVFISLPGKDWHLEFTISDDLPTHRSDEDDLLVFYPESSEQYDELLTRFANHGIAEVAAKNPYWRNNANIFTDPDEYRVLIVKP